MCWFLWVWYKNLATIRFQNHHDQKLNPRFKPSPYTYNHPVSLWKCFSSLLYLLLQQHQHVISLSISTKKLSTGIIMACKRAASAMQPVCVPPTANKVRQIKTIFLGYRIQYCLSSFLWGLIKHRLRTSIAGFVLSIFNLCCYLGVSFRAGDHWVCSLLIFSFFC